MGTINFFKHSMTIFSVKILLDNGCSPNIADFNRRMATELDRKCLENKLFFLYFQCIKILLDNGCSPDITDNNELSAAELASTCK